MCAAGELEPNELARLLKLQESSPARPLGALAEEHAGVDPAAVEAAWAAQMSQWGGRVDPRRLYPEKEAKQLVTPRRARQFNILPISRQGERLSYCTTPLGLVSAHRFVTNVLGLVSELRNQTKDVGDKPVGGNQTKRRGAIRQPLPLPRNRQDVELSRPSRRHQLLRFFFGVEATRIHPSSPLRHLRSPGSLHCRGINTSMFFSQRTEWSGGA